MLKPWSGYTAVLEGLLERRFGFVFEVRTDVGYLEEGGSTTTHHAPPSLVSSTPAHHITHHSTP